MTHSTKRMIAAFALTGLLALAGCGEVEEPRVSDGSSPDGPSVSETPSEAGPSATADPDPAVPDLPTCAQTWSADRLPARYLGCLEGDTVVEARSFTCSSGQRLVTYTNHYAVAGREIVTTGGKVARDRGYRLAIRACTA